MHSYDFTLKYDGDALSSHSMDLQDLAPALLGISELLGNVAKIIVGDDIKISVKIKGNPQEGSICCHLEIVQSILKQFTDLFSSNEASAFSNLMTVLQAVGIVGGAGILGFFLKIKKNKEIANIELKGEQSIITFTDQSTSIEHIHIGQIILNHDCMHQLNKVIKPLEQDGVDTLVFSSNSDDTKVSKDDIPYFKNATVKQILSVQEQTQWLSIESISFKDGNKSKFSDGTSSFYVEIGDDDFMKKINLGEVSFAKHDVLHCLVEIEQSFIQNALKTNRIIKKVIEHKKGMNQVKMDV